MIKNSTGGQLTFTDADGLRCRYTDEAGQKRERYAIFVDGYGKLARKEVDALWPLKIGNTVSFQINESNTVQATDKYFVRDLQEGFTVNRQERVTVPAGTFDTFVIEWNEQETGPNPTGALTTLWYAPSLGYVVKSSVHMLNTSDVSSLGASRYVGLTYDAIQIAMPNGAPVPVATTEPVAPKPVSASSPAAASPAAPASASPEERLRALKDLLDQKLITPDEYETRRKAIVNSL